MKKCPYCDKPIIRVTCGSSECQLKNKQQKTAKWKEKNFYNFKFPHQEFPPKIK